MNTTTDLGAWWGSLALVNAGLAQTKGRSRWYWFVISLFLGPLATFLIVVWAPPVEATKVTGTGTTTAAPIED
jgi:hypothetical protein